MPLPLFPCWNSISSLCASHYHCFTMIKSIIQCLSVCAHLCVTRAKGNSLIPEIDSLWLQCSSKGPLASDHCNPSITESHSPTQSSVQQRDWFIRRLQQVKENCTVAAKHKTAPFCVCACHSGLFVSIISVLSALNILKFPQILNKQVLHPDTEYNNSSLIYYAQ